jgi:hypothetical protein
MNKRARFYDQEWAGICEDRRSSTQLLQDEADRFATGFCNHE